MILAVVCVANPVAVMAAPAEAPDHSTSADLGISANTAGIKFVAGAKLIAEPFIVVGTTIIEGAKFVALKTASGVVYVAEDAFYGLQWVAEGVKVIAIKTAQGIRFVALEAIRLGKVVFENVVDFAELVVENVAYVVVRVKEGVVIVAKDLVEAGKFVVNGITYIAQKTVDGVVWVAQNAANAVRVAANWTREMYVFADVRTRLSSSLAAGSGALPRDLAFFQRVASDARNTSGLRKLAGAAFAACNAFNSAYAPAQ